MKRIFLMLAAALILSGTMAAEIRTVNLSNAIDLALQNNLSISKTEKDIAVAQAQYGESFADLTMPSINGDARYTELDPLTVSEGDIDFNSLLPAGFLPPGVAFPIITNVYPDNYHARNFSHEDPFLRFQALRIQSRSGRPISTWQRLSSGT